jgi:hypothetical protein
MSEFSVPCSAPYIVTAASYESEQITLHVGRQNTYGEFLVPIALLSECTGYFSEWYVSSLPSSIPHFGGPNNLADFIPALKTY